MHPYFVEVKGEIIAEGDTPQYAQGWTCRSIGAEPSNPTLSFDAKKRTVESDLIFNQKVRAIPYAFYFTEKGIRGEHIIFCPGNGGAFWYFYETIENIESKLMVSASKEWATDLYNGLYIEVFSALELLLTDCILCHIFSNDDCYERATMYLVTKDNLCKFAANEESDDIVSKIHNYFFNFVYHRFDKVDIIYKAVLGIDLPDYSALSNNLRRRNNIVHRSSLDGMCRMQVTDCSQDDVHELLLTVKTFANDLIKSLKSY